MFISRTVGTQGALLLAWSPAAEVIMTRTALRRGPVAPPTRGGLHRLDDGELLDLVRSEPIGSALRSDACEVLVLRHEARRADLFFHAPSLDAPATALSYLRDRLLGQDPAAAPSPPPSGSPLTQTRRQA